MTADRRPLPDDLKALKEIIGGRPADPQTICCILRPAGIGRLKSEFDQVVKNYHEK